LKTFEKFWISFLLNILLFLIQQNYFDLFIFEGFIIFIFVSPLYMMEVLVLTYLKLFIKENNFLFYFNG